MSETDVLYLKPLLSGQLHFGEVPEAVQAAIVKDAKAEVRNARRNFPRIDETVGNNSNICFGELGGPATQAFILGNKGALKIGVSKLVKPTQGEQIVTHDDVVHEVVSQEGNFILGYDPKVAKVSTYLVRRAHTVAQRNRHCSPLVTWMTHQVHIVSSELDKLAESKWEPLTTEDYLAVASKLPKSKKNNSKDAKKPKELTAKRAKQVTVKRVKQVTDRYNAGQTTPLTVEADLLDDEGVFDHYVDVFFDNADEVSMPGHDYADERVDLEFEAIDNDSSQFNLEHWGKLTPFKKDLVKKYYGIGCDRRNMYRLADEYGVANTSISGAINKALDILGGRKEPGNLEKAQIKRAARGENYAGPPHGRKAWLSGNKKSSTKHL